MNFNHRCKCEKETKYNNKEIRSNETLDVCERLVMPITFIYLIKHKKKKKKKKKSFKCIKNVFNSYSDSFPFILCNLYYLNILNA